MPRYTADWILPIEGPPIRNGAVTVEDGMVVRVDHGTVSNAVPLGRVAVLPALVNAHTHLELSYMHGRVPPSTSFADWVMALMTLRRGFPDPGVPPILASAKVAIGRAKASGTGLMGDVSNTLVTVPLLREEGMPAHVFYELIGFSHADPAARVRDARAYIASTGAHGRGIRVSLAPHAPYSVSPGLFAAIRADVDADPRGVTSIHLGESAAEVELLRYGRGPTRAMLEKLGVWTDEWKIPRLSPTEYMAGLGFIRPDSLVVHGVQFTSDDLARVKAGGATLVSCPRSNVYVGVGAPPLESFYAAGVPVAFGTDSLASCPDLNMFTELAEARRIAPSVPARDLLRSATLTGAQALRYDDEFGSIEAGKRAALIAVCVPADVADVEEYLVRGVRPDAITWLDSASTPAAPASNAQ